VELLNNRHYQAQRSKKALNFLFQGWINAFRDINSIFERFQSDPKPLRLLLALMLSFLVAWFIYVPIHELLHVAGCVISGGVVHELILDQKYGAVFLSKLFPFIVPQSSGYAGRVSGFDPGSDTGYLITVFFPYILTIFPGVWLLVYSARAKKMWVSGVGMIVGLAPFISLTGDYFEIGTIITTKIWNSALQGYPAQVIEAYWNLRSDDIFRLISEISAEPNLYGLPGFSGFFQVVAIVLSGFFLAILFSGWTYQIGRILAVRLENLACGRRCC
jgi:hypothetical protein